ncbi:MAG: hypothetical protein JRJ69_01425 [Deltaproteobacteria bacterium]|nr:hypothetical protein [Deltaproteobacteria bacterium]MBW1908530.1 hypothetical protein [Deltaproteobacteria bacterium]MBW2032367.1 hypothetical protein [Deltaproteobacteria bacterium]
MMTGDLEPYDSAVIIHSFLDTPNGYELATVWTFLHQEDFPCPGICAG